VRAVQEVLSRLEPVTVRAEGIQHALSEGGVPCTVADLRERFERYVTALSKGKDVAKIRIIIE